MTKIVVFGANSFSGQDFCDLLLDQPQYQVIGVSRSAERSGLFLRYKQRSDLSRYRYYALNMNGDIGEILRLLDAERRNASSTSPRKVKSPRAGNIPNTGSKRIAWRWPDW